MTGLYVSSPAGELGNAEIGVYAPGLELHFNVTAHENATAFGLLSSVANVTHQEYASGKMITAINNVSQDSGHYWLYFINGNLSMASADSQPVVAGDRADFRYLSSDEAAEYFS